MTDKDLIIERSINYHMAKEAGLNEEWAYKVAKGEISLDEALGDMDMNEESKGE